MFFRPWFAFVLGLIAVGTASRDGWAQLRIAMENGAAGSTVVSVSSLSAEDLAQLKTLDADQLRATLRMFVKGQEQAILGQCEFHEKSGVIFRPRFPFQPGLTYVAEFRSPSKKVHRQEFSIAKPELKPSASVEILYPTADVLPQNLLKFYLHFSAPMSQGVAYDYIELRNDDGKLLEHPFLEIAEELWDRTGQRLTLLLDPGRVKRGLVPREQDGPILNQGAHYRLTIKGDWPDARGVPMVAPFVKKFRVAAEDFTQPTPANWRLTIPKPGTREPLVVTFPEPLDHAVLMRGLTVHNSRDELVEGILSTDKRETVALFQPGTAWAVGGYSLRASTLIEDVAGNSIERAFEVDRFDKIDRSRAKFQSLEFQIAP